MCLFRKSDVKQQNLVQQADEYDSEDIIEEQNKRQSFVTDVERKYFIELINKQKIRAFIKV